jgi:pantothenate kinase
MMTRMATDVYRRVRWGDKVGPAESASLYMNPVTQKLVNVTVSWEPDVADIIKALQKLKKNSDDTGAPLLVGVVGLPGSGKSTSCDILATYLGNRTMVMPMDGYHLSLEQLGQMPDPADVIYRRGAPDTFDPQSLKEDLQKIKYGKDIPHVLIPGFDHAVGDPSPDQHTFIRDQHDIVIVEGIYLMHQDDGWADIKSMLDFCIYIEADIDTCINRLKIRNQCIPGYTKEEIEIRCEAVDRVNAETVLKSSGLAGLSVKSSAMSNKTPPIIARGDDSAEECDIVGATTEEEIEQYVETIQEEVEAIIQEL